MRQTDRTGPAQARGQNGSVLLFGEALYGGAYYDTQSLENLQESRGACLRDEMNGLPLPAGLWRGLCGSGLKISSDTKWSSGLTASSSSNRKSKLGEGEGGKNEDDEYFDLLPNI